MFLIFALNRPDVLPVGDLGVRAGLRDRHGLADLPRPGECHALAEPWRPYRTVASWYLWQGLDPAAPAERPGGDAYGDHADCQCMPIPMNFDLILKNGWVIDGSGGPPFRADVALLDTMIGDVGRLDGATAPRALDVTGRYVVPGFIDAHVHGDLMLLADPIHLPALRQGVTTYIIGQDGCSFAPARPRRSTT